ncbi:unnamed protein product [Euphydryas editha]|uniref:Uncharacterized protein n=1 Tax=Euphydryas editha TaxID=104508 RepID=A0AAU9TUP6_EUPED|nr:unnamed protein product [Euphydryas editha]
MRTCRYGAIGLLPLVGDVGAGVRPRVSECGEAVDAGVRRWRIGIGVTVTGVTGKTSSLISISEALVPVIYSPVYSKVYLSTLSTFAGAFYLISAALAVPAIVIYLSLFILRKRESEESETTENKSKEDEVTRF